MDTFLALLSELMETRIFVAIIIVVASYLIHFANKKFDKPEVLKVAKKIAKTVRDINTEATWSQYFDMFYRSIRHVKNRDPDESEWETAIKVFKEELLEDELEKVDGSEAEA